MSFALYVDSSNSLSFNPEFDFTRQDRKIEDIHRVRSGERYIYKWGDYDRITFGLKFVTSSDMAIINSWWNTNTELLFMDEDTTEIFSVTLTNRDTPIGKQALPYSNQFLGRIELETY